MMTQAEQTEVVTQYWKALDAIWKIVHIRTKDTPYRRADDHYMADFDQIRKIITQAMIKK